MTKRELTPEQEARIFRVFKKLDVTNDGKISPSDLKVALKRLNITTLPGQGEEQVARVSL
jgi:Ca2+-binding EF-hand superfamily protein